MSVLVDTNVLVGGWLDNDPLYSIAAPALDRATEGAWGAPVVTDFILDEAVTLALKRSRSHRHADRLASFVLGEAPFPTRFKFLNVGPEVFREARLVFRLYNDRELSFTDCTSIAMVRAHRLRAILSHDHGFDGIVPRLDPADASAAPA